jgi:hypothetical protein
LRLALSVFAVGKWVLRLGTLFQARNAARESRREAKYGRSAHRNHYQAGQGRSRGGGRADFKGYFKLLGAYASIPPHPSRFF